MLFIAALSLSAFAQTRGDIKKVFEPEPQPQPQPEWYWTWPYKFDCASVNKWTDNHVSHVTTNNELRLNYAPPTSSDTVPYTSTGGSKPRVLVGTSDPNSKLTTDASSDQKSVTWSSDKAIAAVLVAGTGDNTTRIYWMPENTPLGTVFSGSNYRSANGSKITKLAFCYHEPATVTIIKEVQGTNGASSVAFPFSSTNLRSPSAFSLVDNNDGSGSDRLITKSYAFGKFGKTVTVTEGTTENWTLSDITCTEQDTIGGQVQYSTSVNFQSRKATIGLEEGEKVTCTFKNTNLRPSAASVPVSGRVVTAYGTPIAGAKVYMINAGNGVTSVAITNPFGYYTFDEIEVENYYTVSVSHKSYTFSETQRPVFVSDSLEVQDFVADPK